VTDPTRERLADSRAALQAKEALAALALGDHHGAYTSAKWWISAGGGAWQLDPWLLYVASGVLAGKPRIATHSADLAFRGWLALPAERAVMHWARAAVVLRQLRDPKTAHLDLDAACDETPAWLEKQVQRDVLTCQKLASKSRKSKPSVAPAPTFAPFADRGFVSAPLGSTSPSTRPPLVWSAVLPFLLSERSA